MKKKCWFVCDTFGDIQTVEAEHMQEAEGKYLIFWNGIRQEGLELKPGECEVQAKFLLWAYWMVAPEIVLVPQENIQG